MSENTLNSIREYLFSRQEEIFENLRKLVAIQSVGCIDASAYPYGKACAEALDFALALAAEKGLHTENCAYYYGLAQYGYGERHIGIFSHLDVVPAGEGWIYPPFECTEKDGWLIGRGVGDDKIAAILGIYVLSAIKELGIAKNCRFTLFFGCDEESGMKDVERYVLERSQPDLCLVPDIRFPVCTGEKGNVNFTLNRPVKTPGGVKIHGGLATNIVPALAEAEIARGEYELWERIAKFAEGRPDIRAAKTAGGKIHIIAEGNQSSSSMAFNGINAIGLLCSFLAECGIEADDAEMAEYAAMCSQWDGGVFGIAVKDDFYGPLTVPCVFFEMNDSEVSLQFNLRYPAGADWEEILSKITAYAERKAWTIKVTSHSSPHSIPKDSPAVGALVRAWSDITGKEGFAFAIGGGTYARKLKNAVGFGPDDGTKCPFLPDGHGGIHGPDEARSIKCIMEAMLVYGAAICRLSELEKL